MTADESTLAAEYDLSLLNEISAFMNQTEEEKVETRRQPAGLGRRLLAIVYDAVIVLGLLILATAVMMPFADTQPVAMKDPVFTLWLLCIWFLYLCWCWRKNMTLGMRAWKLRLETSTGKPLPVSRCVLRFVVSLVGGAALGVGYLWSLTDSRSRCWHDMASGSRVVRIVD